MNEHPSLALVHCKYTSV